MTTGKTEDPFWVEMHKQAAEHPTEQARLERAVIEAAKKWWLHPETPRGAHDIPLFDVVEALVRFEAEQNDAQEG